MIIDAHAHVTEASYGSIENLIERYDEVGIEKGVLVPGGMLDVRKMSQYILEAENGKKDYIPNWLVKDAMDKHPDRVFGFYCVNPLQGETVVDEFIDAVKNKGFCGLKLAPIVHKFSLTDPVVKELAKACEELDVPMFFHVTHLPGSSTNDAGLLVKDFLNTKFILGHMGFGQADTLAIEYAKKFENLYLETSCGSTLIVKQAIETLGDKKVIFGSEYPMDDPFYALSKITCLKLKEQSFENITCNNILSIINK